MSGGPQVATLRIESIVPKCSLGDLDISNVDICRLSASGPRSGSGIRGEEY